MADADYPKTLLELEEQFRSELDCLEYLFRIRWPDGFICPCCEGRDAWVTGRGLFMCKLCNRQTSVTAGTLFHQSRKPLPLWFRATWHITTQKYGANALGLKRVLELGSYNTAWQWLHKFRRAMVRPGRDNLSGVVEVDETYIGGRKPGKRGRGAEGKMIVAVAVEDKGDDGIGRIRLGHVPDASAQSLHPFIQDAIQKGSQIRTDDWAGYEGIEKIGYTRSIVSSEDAKLAHLVISLLKRWILGTYQGSVKPSHLTYYLDEFTFRFNRRSSKARGLLFYRLMQHAMQVDPAPLPTLKGTVVDFLNE
jgi:transposase-like protein